MQARGFTLIEMVTVIALTGIIAVVLSRVISRPIEGFLDLGLRAELVDVGELALRRSSREIRLALPNSLRITDGATQNLQTCSAGSGAGVCAVEILRTLDGGRYRERRDGTDNDQCPGAGDDDRLDFNAQTDCFEILGALTGVAQVQAAPGATQSDCLAGTVDCLVVFNTGQAGANAYAGDDIAGIQAVTAASLTFDIGPTVTHFPLESPRQRFQIVDTPVSFICDAGAGTLTRAADYAIASVQSTSPGGSVDLLADKVTSCSFTYNKGAGTRNGLLTVEVVVTGTDTQGNSDHVRLVQQTEVPNVP